MKTNIELISERYGWPMKIQDGDFTAYLCDVQNLNAGEEPLPIYRYPGGTKVVTDIKRFAN